METHTAEQTPEQTRRWLEAIEPWRAESIGLISLLLHDEPAVYIGDGLPSMNQVGDVPTKPLDTFEADGLEALRGGEDLSISREGDLVRMLGAIRSHKNCVACHGGERGDLLGAFTYTLRWGERSADD